MQNTSEWVYSIWVQKNKKNVFKFTNKIRNNFNKKSNNLNKKIKMLIKILE